MIDNEIKATQTSTLQKQEKVTSPISKSYQKSTAKKNSFFVAWLNDEDSIEENNGKISAKDAAQSFAKGLIEIVKTVYKKPLAAAITVATGVILTYFAHYSALSVVMGLCIAGGAAGLLYAGYTISKTTSSNIKKQAFEVVGISMFVMAIGLYGLLI